MFEYPRTFRKAEMKIIVLTILAVIYCSTANVILRKSDQFQDGVVFLIY